MVKRTRSEVPRNSENVRRGPQKSLNPASPQAYADTRPADFGSFKEIPGGEGAWDFGFRELWRFKFRVSESGVEDFGAEGLRD